jgi:hypothetical protein
VVDVARLESVIPSKSTQNYFGMNSPNHRSYEVCGGEAFGPKRSQHIHAAKCLRAKIH